MFQNLQALSMATVDSSPPPLVSEKKKEREKSNLRPDQNNRELGDLVEAGMAQW